MMAEPLLGIAVIYAERFGILPTVFQDTATVEDMRLIMAADMIRSDDWRKEYDRQQQQEKTAKMSPEEYVQLFKRGLGAATGDTHG